MRCGGSCGWASLSSQQAWEWVQSSRESMSRWQAGLEPWPASSGSTAVCWVASSHSRAKGWGARLTGVRYGDHLVQIRRDADKLWQIGVGHGAGWFCHDAGWGGRDLHSMIRYR